MVILKTFQDSKKRFRKNPGIIFSLFFLCRNNIMAIYINNVKPLSYLRIRKKGICLKL